jgi:hypothetical protein
LIQFQIWHIFIQAAKFWWPTQKLSWPPNFLSFYCVPLQTSRGPLGGQVAHVENRWSKLTSTILPRVTSILGGRLLHPKPVRLSVGPRGRPRLPLDGFSWNLRLSKICRENSSLIKTLQEQDRQCACNVTFWCVRVTIVAVEIQQCIPCVVELDVTVYYTKICSAAQQCFYGKVMSSATIQRIYVFM